MKETLKKCTRELCYSLNTNKMENIKPYYNLTYQNLATRKCDVGDNYKNRGKKLRNLRARMRSRVHQTTVLKIKIDEVPLEFLFRKP